MKTYIVVLKGGFAFSVNAERHEKNSETDDSRLMVGDSVVCHVMAGQISAIIEGGHFKEIITSESGFR